ncbi:MAG: Uma2 family endonuclease [Deltaproteobacteria bacterium]|nr:Uma2 family endonuclease [Deltaproteobacteria bacterium]
MRPVESLTQERIRPLERAWYDRCVAMGAFGEDERLELLEGQIIVMSPHGTPHAYVIQCLMELFVRVLSGRAQVRIQLPFAASADSEPEPDVALVPPRSTRAAGFSLHADAAVHANDRQGHLTRSRRGRDHGREDCEAESGGCGAMARARAVVLVALTLGTANCGSPAPPLDAAPDVQQDALQYDSGVPDARWCGLVRSPDTTCQTCLELSCCFEGAACTARPECIDALPCAASCVEPSALGCWACSAQHPGGHAFEMLVSCMATGCDQACPVGTSSWDVSVS